MSEEIINLNVGGRNFSTYKSTLLAYPDTMLAKMFSNMAKKGPNGDYFLDRNPDIFSIILEYYRNKVLLIPKTIPVEAVVNELHYFGFDYSENDVQIGESVDDTIGNLKENLSKAERNYNILKSLSKPETLILAAVSRDDIKEIEALIDQVDIRYMDLHPLIYAAAIGSLLSLKKLLEMGVAIEAKEKIHGDTALLTACFRGQVEIVQELLKSGANPFVSSRQQKNGLHYAATNGHLEIVKIMLQQNLDINSVTGEQLAPIHLALFRNHVAVVKELIARGANVEMADNNGQKPLEIAAFIGSLEVVKELIKAGAKIDFSQKPALDNYNILHMCAKHTDVLKFFLEQEGAKAHLNDKGKGGNTVLDTATINKAMESVEVLLKHGAKISGPK